MALLEAGTKGRSVPIGLMAAEVKALQLLWRNSDILDAVVENRLTPDLEALLATELLFYPCSHVKMYNQDPVLAQVADVLRADLTSGGSVTAASLRTAPNPSLCEFPAGRLRNGSLPGIAAGNGGVGLLGVDAGLDSPAPLLADLTGDGVGDALGVFYCSHGGVGWPQVFGAVGPWADTPGHR